MELVRNERPRSCLPLYKGTTGREIAERKGIEEEGKERKERSPNDAGTEKVIVDASYEEKRKKKKTGRVEGYKGIRDERGGGGSAWELDSYIMTRNRGHIVCKDT